MPLIAKRYAQAMFDLSEETRHLPEVHKDLNNILTLLSASHDLARFINNPVIPSIRQTIIIEELFTSKISARVIQFLLFLIRKRRLNYLASIAEEFNRLYLAHQGAVIVKIVSPIALDVRQVNAIGHHFKLKQKINIVSTVETAPELIGGLKIQMRDTVYDHSVKTQLDSFFKAVVHG